MRVYMFDCSILRIYIYVYIYNTPTGNKTNTFIYKMCECVHYLRSEEIRLNSHQTKRKVIFDLLASRRVISTRHVLVIKHLTCIIIDTVAKCDLTLCMTHNLPTHNVGTCSLYLPTS